LIITTCAVLFLGFATSLFSPNQKWWKTGTLMVISSSLASLVSFGIGFLVSLLVSSG